MAGACKHREQHVSLILLPELGLPPPDRRFRLQDREVGVRPGARANQDVHTTQGRHPYTQIGLKLSPKEVAPQIQQGLNPNVGLTQSHEGHHM
jgi:hypothetical protein